MIGMFSFAHRPGIHVAWALSVALGVTMPASPGRAAEAKVDYDRDIRPIFSENCYTCHGPDAAHRKAKFRLDTKEGAFKELRSGGHVIVSGKAADSVLIQRITADEPTEHMPPPK